MSRENTYFTRIAEKERVTDPLFLTRDLPFITEFLTKNNNAHETVKPILDIGCQTGNYYDFFKKIHKNIQYTGFDVNEAIIDTAYSLHLE